MGSEVGGVPPRALPGVSPSLGGPGVLDDSGGASEVAGVAVAGMAEAAARRAPAVLATSGARQPAIARVKAKVMIGAWENLKFTPLERRLGRLTSMFPGPGRVKRFPV